MHPIAGSRSCKNLNIMHCVTLMDSSRRVYGSSIAARIGAEVDAMLEIPKGNARAVQIAPLDIRFKHKETGPSVLAATEWFAHRYVRPTSWERVGAVTSINACNAPEINRSAFQKSCVFHFAGVALWQEIGIQVLKHGGWPPECAIASRHNVPKLLPPPRRWGRYTLEEIKYRRMRRGQGPGSKGGHT